MKITVIIDGQEKEIELSIEALEERRKQNEVRNS